MKTLSILFALLVSFQLSAQTQIESLFEQYSNDKSFTSIRIMGAMLETMLEIANEGENDADAKAAMEAVKGIKDIVVLTTEQNPMQHYNTVINKLNLASYKPLVNVRDGGDNVHIYCKEANKKIEELLIVVGSAEEFVLVNLMGTIDFKQLKKVAKGANMPMPSIDKVNKAIEQAPEPRP